MALRLGTCPLRRYLSARKTIAHRYVLPSIVAALPTTTQRQIANHAMTMPHLCAERSNGTCMYSAVLYILTLKDVNICSGRYFGGRTL